MDKNKLSIYEPHEIEVPKETCFLDLMRRQYLMYMAAADGPDTPRLVMALETMLDDFLRFVSTVVGDPGACIVYDEDRIRIKLLSDTFIEDHPRPKKPA